MSSRCLSVAALLVLAGAELLAASTLKVCADPQQLPFSNQRQQGFENKLADLLGEELGATVSFEWVRPSRGFVREVVNTGRCDLLIEVPVGMRGVLVTRPYYRSTYVFVTRADSKVVRSFDDPALRQMKIGVHALDEDFTPPATALARRNLSVEYRCVSVWIKALVTSLRLLRTTRSMRPSYGGRWPVTTPRNMAVSCGSRRYNRSSILRCCRSLMRSQLVFARTSPNSMRE